MWSRSSEHMKNIELKIENLFELLISNQIPI
jgi:hypothetical protein